AVVPDRRPAVVATGRAVRGRGEAGRGPVDLRRGGVVQAVRQPEAVHGPPGGGHGRDGGAAGGRGPGGGRRPADQLPDDLDLLRGGGRGRGAGRPPGADPPGQGRLR